MEPSSRHEALPDPGAISSAGLNRIEQRVRARRIERCLATASASLLRHELEPVGAALEEVRQLDPENASAAALEAELKALRRYRTARRMGSVVAVTMSLAFVLFAVTRFNWAALNIGPARSEKSDEPAQTVARAEDTVAPPTLVPQPAIASVPQQPAEPTATERPADAAVIREVPMEPSPPQERVPALPPPEPALSPPPPERGPGPLPQPARADAASVPAPRNAAARPETRPSSPEPARTLVPAAPPVRPAPTGTSGPEPGTTAPPEPAVPPPPLPAPPPQAATAAAPVAAAADVGAGFSRIGDSSNLPKNGSLGDSALPPAGAAGSSASTVVPAAVPVDEDRQIRQVLEKYRAAYEKLDARSAQQVWPGVNGEALARAFDSLASQSVTFNACRIEVLGTTAKALCSGSARYVPRIGSREPRVESRSWDFRLRRIGPDWRIEQARADR